MPENDPEQTVRIEDFSEVLEYLGATAEVLASFVRAGVLEGPVGPNHEYPVPVTRTRALGAAVQLWLDNADRYLPDAEQRPCPACESTDSSLLFESHDRHLFRECQRCGMWYVSPMVKLATFSRFARENEQFAGLLAAEATEKLSTSHTESDVSRIGEYLRTVSGFVQGPARITYLDIGTGVGNALEAAAQLGWGAVGLEALESAVERARELGRPVHLGTAESAVATLGEMTVDVVSLWEVLEHVEAPREALAQARSLLSDQGILALTVPNAQSMGPLLLRAECHYCYGGFDGPGHVNLFSMSTLERLLGDSGFEIIHAETLYGTNWLDLAHGVSGRGERIFNLRTLVDRTFRRTAPCNPHLISVVNALGPHLTAIERHFRLGPLLFVLARPTASRKRPARAVPAPLPTIPRRALPSSQRDITLRDRLLVEAHNDRAEIVAHLQDEVSRRDSLLETSHLERTEIVQRLQDEVSRLQDEISKRDALLETAHLDHVQGVAELLREISRRDSLLADAHIQIGQRAEQLHDEISKRDAFLETAHLDHAQSVAQLLGEISRRDSLLADAHIQIGKQVEGLLGEVTLRDEMLRAAEAERLRLSALVEKAARRPTDCR